MAPLLCRRWTTATLRELSVRFGLSHPDSASDLIKRGRRIAESNRDVARMVASTGKALGFNPEHDPGASPSRRKPRRQPNCNPNRKRGLLRLCFGLQYFDNFATKTKFYEFAM